jgi:hypothetical protein
VDRELDASRQLLGACRTMKDAVREAFLAVRDERSPDVVVADPILNKRFLQECRNRGLHDDPLTLNRCLLNLRKSSDLQGIKSKRVFIKNQDDFRFASEIAVRFLERKHQVSLDQILCDPVRVVEFDAVAVALAPGFSPFEYRWAALNLRKKRKLRPELLGQVVPAVTLVSRRAVDVKIAELPAQAGLYIFIDKGQGLYLYIGECKNLQKRIGKHLDHSDNKSLARWLWEHGITDLHLEYHVLPAGVPARVRKAMESELIRSGKPVYNIAGTE